MNVHEEVNLGELAEEALYIMSDSIERQQIRITLHPGLPVIYGNRSRCLEVMQNLISNAIKFMGDQPEPTIEIGVRQDNDNAVFYVQDNGMGIPFRFREKIFDLFERLHPNLEGTGVGLALVKRIIELHKGHIWMESEGEGRGSTFCFTFP